MPYSIKPQEKETDPGSGSGQSCLPSTGRKSLAPRMPPDRLGESTVTNLGCSEKCHPVQTTDAEPPRSHVLGMSEECQHRRSPGRPRGNPGPLSWGSQGLSSTYLGQKRASVSERYLRKVLCVTAWCELSPLYSLPAPLWRASAFSLYHVPSPPVSSSTPYALHLAIYGLVVFTIGLKRGWPACAL